ncbi:MAG: pepsin/retropepsin-like aspartic protease family protein [bacterium]
MTILVTGMAVADSVPFDPTRGLVEVPVIIDGRVNGSLGIDTGADRLYIDSTFAHRNGLSFVRSIPQRPVTGIEGTSPAGVVEIRSLRVGGDALFNLQATAIDLHKLIRDQSHGFPDGLIGHEFLRRFYVTVDYPGRSLKLEMGLPDFKKSGGADLIGSIDFSTHRHLIVVEVTFDSGVTAPMILDYCASYTAVSRSLANRLGLNAEHNKRQIVPFMSIGSILNASQVPVVVTDLSHFKKSLRWTRFEGIVGASFLHKYKLTIDYKADRIYVHRR